MYSVPRLFVLPLFVWGLYKKEQTTLRDHCSLFCGLKFNMKTLEPNYTWSIQQEQFYFPHPTN